MRKIHMSYKYTFLTKKVFGFRVEGKHTQTELHK